MQFVEKKPRRKLTYQTHVTTVWWDCSSKFLNIKSINLDYLEFSKYAELNSSRFPSKYRTIFLLLNNDSFQDSNIHHPYNTFLFLCSRSLSAYSRKESKQMSAGTLNTPRVFQSAKRLLHSENNNGTMEFKERLKELRELTTTQQNEVRTSQRLKAVNYFRQKLYRRCSTGF